MEATNEKQINEYLSEIPVLPAGLKVLYMVPTPPSYSPEFTAEMLRLYKAGKIDAMNQLAKMIDESSMSVTITCKTPTSYPIIINGVMVRQN